MDRKLLIDIGVKCSEIRKKCGYTQKELAIQFQIPQTQLANFEYGKVNNAVIYNWYLALAKEYNIEV